MQWEVGGRKFPHRLARTIRLCSVTMAKKLAIAACDHREPLFDEVHGRVAFGRGLPIVAPDGFEPEDHRGDLTLARAGAVPVDGLEHAPRTRQLLTCEARVGWNRTAMKGGQKPGDGLHSIEALDPERDHGGKRLADRTVSGKRQVETLPVAQLMQYVKAVLGPMN